MARRVSLTRFRDTWRTRYTYVSRDLLCCMTSQWYQASCETLFKDFDVRESINVLHGVVTDARARKQRGEMEAKDVWREDLEPRAAVRARTVPILESDVERLKAMLQSVSLSITRHQYTSTHVYNSSRTKI